MIGVFIFSTRGHLTAVDYMFKKYIEKLRTHDPACPLCHRPFDEQTEVDELISEARMFYIYYSFLLYCVTFVTCDCTGSHKIELIL